MLSRPPSRPGHGDPETLPFFADPVGGRDADVVEVDHGGGLVVPADLALLGAEGEAGRPVLDHEGRDPPRALAAACAP